MRLARLYAPDLPNVVVVNFLPHLSARWASDLAAAPFNPIVKWLGEQSAAEGVRVHGWSLTPQALRLVATPMQRQSLARTVQGIGRRLSAHVGGGSAYSGRYRSTLIEPGRWVLPCLIWVESAPTRDGYAPDPAGWRWSSASTHTGLSGAGCVFLNHHHDYWSFGNTPFDRQARYKERLQSGLLEEQVQAIEAAVRGQWALGSESFVSGLSGIATRRVRPAPRGRPRKIGALKIDAKVDEGAD
jgi:putative transposase